MNLWIDDIRNPKDHGWAGAHWAKTAHEANEIIRTGKVTSVSFDHDLGAGPAAYECAKLIEKLCAEGKIMCPIWRIHSSNPVGRQRIAAAMLSAERLAPQIS